MPKTFCIIAIFGAEKFLREIWNIYF
jgi:hypothetical protein